MQDSAHGYNIPFSDLWRQEEGIMSLHEASIIIPVLNNWQYTENCLNAVAQTLAGEAVEIIVIDNGSSDATPKNCPALGNALFGDSFHYQRNETNINFGPASNQGAKIASGQYLIFLNNDTIPQSGWYRPLLDDFNLYPDIGATGPLLAYPPRPPFGLTVQHLGVRLSALFKIGHLYQCIPVDSPLARKRRFFQVITAACMVMPRELFTSLGMFDEGFINGFEDVELCARLARAGYKATVNPDSLVIHYESATPNRHDAEVNNSALLLQKCRDILTPNLAEQIALDGMTLALNEWQQPLPMLPPEIVNTLDAAAGGLDFESLKNLVTRYPFWHRGWLGMIAKCDNVEWLSNLLWACYNLFPGAGSALANCEFYQLHKNRKMFNIWLPTAFSHCKSFEEYVATARENMEKLAHSPAAAALYADWLDHAQDFGEKALKPFLNDLWQLALKGNVSLNPFDPEMYELWRQMRNRQDPSREVPDNTENILFSILMPVYNPRPEHLRAAIDSVLAQTWPHWELCIADDASTDSPIAPILADYARRDARIRITWRETNGHIAVASNTALDMASGTHAVLMDQDDLISADALELVADHIKTHPEGSLFYSDEDKINDLYKFYSPYLKNDRWDWELIGCQNCVSHLGIYRVDRMRAIGGFREGFAGSQDYDLVLRYINGLTAANIVHIPRVLYHWRSHANSTAFSLNAKSYALESSLKAASEWLAKRCANATIEHVPHSIWHRIKYPLPKERPSVSIICPLPDAPFPLKEFLEAWHTKTEYPFELMLVAPQQNRFSLERLLERQPNARIAVCRRSDNIAQRCQLGLDASSGQVVGFIGPDTIPASQNWLEELVSTLWRDNIGACGGKIFMPNGAMDHGGYMVDCTGRLKRLFHNHAADNRTWFGWTVLARTVDALDFRSIFIRRELLQQGLDSAMGLWAFQDFCLKIAQAGWRTVWWPYAIFQRFNSEFALRENMPPIFESEWQGKLAPFSENVRAESNMLLCPYI